METREDAVRSGAEALAAGDWLAARAAFKEAMTGADDAELHLGLGRSLWWLQDVDGALLQFEKAYAGFRSRGDRRDAASAALWLSREYAAAHGNEPASAGWYARAEGLLREEGRCAEQGWLALARAERAVSPEGIVTDAREALEVAREFDEVDLEAMALAKVGYAEVAGGDVVVGTAKLDEAMAAATGGEVARLETIGDVTCTAIAAFELAADWQRIERWGRVIEAWIQQHDDARVVGFCNTCCAELFLSSGQWEQAEGLLTEGLAVLSAGVQRARCVHPAAKLAELRLLQGRIEEAEQLLAGYEELPEATHALASLHMARGEVKVGAALLHRRLNRIGSDSVLAAPFLALLVDAQLAEGDPDAAASSAERLIGIGQRSELPRIRAAGTFAAGKVATAQGRDGIGSLDDAVAAFASQGMSLDAARARMHLARALARSQPEVAVADARTSLSEFERLGAPRDADEAAAFLRGLGAAGRTGPKGLDLLTRREREVLQLLGQGLSNAEIAARLFISTKTAGHHVSSVLSKLHFKNRSEAAAYALRFASLTRLPTRNRESAPSFPPCRGRGLRCPQQGGEALMAQRIGKNGSNVLRRELSMSVERRTAAAPDAVYDVLADLRTHAVWGGEQQSETTRILSIDAPAGEASVGTEFETTGADPMGRFTDRSVVTTAIRAKVFEFVTEASLETKKGARSEWTNVHRYELRPDGDGAVIVYTFRIARISALPGLLRLFNLPVLSGLAMKMAASVPRRGIENLAHMAEQRADAR